MQNEYFQKLTVIKQKQYQKRQMQPGHPVGPFNNPTETYPYYSLPFCEGTGRQRRHKQDLGETLSGSRKVATPYELTFLDPVPWRSLCEDYLDAKDVSCLLLSLSCCNHPSLNRHT